MAVKKSKAKAPPKSETAPEVQSPDIGAAGSDKSVAAKNPKRAFAHSHNRMMLIPHPEPEIGTLRVQSWHIITSNPRAAAYLEGRNDFVEIPVERARDFVRLVKQAVTPNVRQCALVIRGGEKK